MNATCPKCDGPATRETDTMDTFVDSSWYFLRYSSPHASREPFSDSDVHEWCPVDQYTGGAEHAVMHLLYARFYVKALRDLGYLRFDEPFSRLFNQGTILSGHAKMSKSRGNVIAPDEYVRVLGADVVRLYLMFIGPWEGGGDWSDTGINGMARWVNRLWDLCLRDTSALPELNAIKDRDVTRLLHKTIKRVVMDLERFKFNTALSAMMELTNELTPLLDSKLVSRPVFSDLVTKLLLLLAPMAPHITEELWENTGHDSSIHLNNIPSWDEDLIIDEEVILVVQVNGKLRDKIMVSAGIQEQDAKELALSSDKVRPYTDGKEIRNVIYVPSRALISIVVGS